MCFALDMPCGASGLYIISNLRQQIYRIRRRRIYRFCDSKNIDKHPIRCKTSYRVFSSPKMRNDPFQLAVKPLTTAVRIISQSAWVPSLVTSLSSRSRIHTRDAWTHPLFHFYITISGCFAQVGKPPKDVPVSLCITEKCHFPAQEC